MWTDNITDKDFLGFDVHASLIKELLEDEKMLPVTIGLFGDWGSGKSSILKVLKNEFEKENKTACLYFNGWVFEGYDDAKAALLETILKELEDEKKFGDGLKDDIKKLYKSVNWMRVIGFSLKNIALPTAAAYMTGGLSLIPQLAEGLKNSTSNPDELITNLKGDNAEEFIKKFINETEEPDSFDVVRKFRDDFEKLLGKSKIEKLVIIIDDLDRCLPDRIIDNLEAIKLFLNVKNTAFIIGADPRIVRHAIEYRYRDKIVDINAKNKNVRVVDDYLEKLIQIPYNLPKLSDSEVETYITLLFCEKDLDPVDFNKTLEAFKIFREKDRYSVFNFSRVKEALEDNSKTKDLEDNVSLIAKLSPIISSSLYGNPRQIKRFLNTFMLRKKLATIAKITDFKDHILAKLMILEYAEPTLFEELYNWQISNQGIAEEINKLEKASCTDKSLAEIEIDKAHKEWDKPKVINWLSSEPFLADIDLRDYFWISRDKLSSMQSGLLIPPKVRALMQELEPEDMAKKLTRSLINDKLKMFDTNERTAFFNLLKQRIITGPEQKRFYDIFDIALKEGLGCKSFYLDALQNVGAKLPPAIKESLKRSLKDHPEFEDFV